MDGGKCILQLRGVRPFFSKKYDITRHKNYRFLSDYDKKNHFDVTEYLSAKLKLKADDQYEVFECEITDTPSAKQTAVKR